MSPKGYLRWLLAVSLLCEIARPAFADGALPSEEQWTQFLITAAIVIVIAVVVLVLFVRAMIIALRGRAERPAQTADPTVPAARVVRIAANRPESPVDASHGGASRGSRELAGSVERASGAEASLFVRDARIAGASTTHSRRSIIAS